MLAELAIANAAFSVIKQTLSNGKEIADAGSALTKYFGASLHQSILLMQNQRQQSLYRC